MILREAQDRECLAKTLDEIWQAVEISSDSSRDRLASEARELYKSDNARPYANNEKPGTCRKSVLS